MPFVQLLAANVYIYQGYENSSLKIMVERMSIGSVPRWYVIAGKFQI